MERQGIALHNVHTDWQHIDTKNKFYQINLWRFRWKYGRTCAKNL